MKYILSLVISGALAVSGYSQTRNVLVNSNNAVVSPTNFWSVDASNARTGLGLGTAATNSASAFQPSSATLSNLASNNAVNLTNLRATNIVGTLSITQGGTGATNAANARTALGLGTASTNDASAFQPASSNLTNLASNNGGSLTNIPASSVKGVLTLSNGSLTNLTITIGATNRGLYATDGPERVALVVGGANTLQVFSNSVETATGVGLAVSGAGSFATNVQIGGPLSFSGTNASGNAGATRTNLSLGWSALTNSNAGTGLVSVSTNGEVVSPTNFWQAAPITPTFVETQPTTNSTTNISASRFLHVHSLATNIVNVTNTIALPTNGTAFAGDTAVVVHYGPTNSMTRVRAVGTTNDLITMTRYGEAVNFVFYNGIWQFDHNAAFVEPIYFSGTNATANAAASRTNLGLGATNVVAFADIEITKTGTNSVYAKNDAGAFQVQVGTNSPSFAISSSSVDIVPSIIAYSNVSVDGDINVAGAISVTNAAATRTNLGIPLAALTNTNNAKFQEAIFATNAAPTNAGNFGDHAAWMGVSIVTNGVTNVFRIPLYQ